MRGHWRLVYKPRILPVFSASLHAHKPQGITLVNSREVGNPVIKHAAKQTEAGLHAVWAPNSVPLEGAKPLCRPASRGIFQSTGFPPSRE